MRNKKHLQGICNNIVDSLTKHPGNYFRFWSHLYSSNFKFDLIFHLLIDNDYSQHFTGKQCQDFEEIATKFSELN